MRKASIIAVFGLIALVQPASALCTSYPNTLTNGTTADGGQVMANFNCAALTSGATLNGVTFTGTTSFPGSSTITSAGLLGIGSSSPTALLHAEKNSNGDAAIRVVNTTNGTAASARMDLAGGSTGSLSELTISQFAPAFTGTGFGQILGGWSSILENTDASHGSGLIIGTSVAHPVVFGVQNTERGRFGSDGSFLVGTTSNGGWPSGSKAEIRGTGHALSVYNSASGTGGNPDALLVRVDQTNSWFANFYYTGSQVGTITTNGSSTSYNTTSDARLKDIAVPQRDYRDAIQKIWIGDFRWKRDGNAGFGVVAQQAYTVFPQAIQKPVKEADIWQADYSKLAPLALWGVKDLYKGADARDQRIASLESEVKRLKKVNANASDQITGLLTRVAALERSGHVRTAQR